MKITEKNLEYTLKFDNDKELKEFIMWCFDNLIFEIVRLHYYPNKSSFNSATIVFEEEELAMAFKLRWI